MSNPNIFVTPTIRPPFPAWSASTSYNGGEVVYYAGQNWVCLYQSDGTVPPLGDAFNPVRRQICQNGLGIYNTNTGGAPVAYNPNGGCWVNLSLASPPAMPWSPFPDVSYSAGQIVMYPPGKPGTYWASKIDNNFNNPPTAGQVSSQPTNFNSGFVGTQPGRTPIVPRPAWQNFINPDTQTPVPFFPNPSLAARGTPQSLTGVSGPTQTWTQLSTPLKGTAAVPKITTA